MKVRLTGTRAECDRFTTELLTATPPGVVQEVSGFYPNRGTSLLGRVYLDLQLPPEPESAAGGAGATDLERPTGRG